MHEILVPMPATEPEWDGMAEEWFAIVTEFDAVYGKATRDAHDDADANTIRVEILAVREITYA
jgi:hypothetical protein